MNRRTFLRATGVAGTAALCGAGVSSASPDSGSGSREAEVLVGVSEAADDVEAVVADDLPAEAEVVHKNETLSYVSVALPEQATDRAREQFVEAITEKSDVRYAERNGTYEALYSPNDPRFDDQYAPQMVNADGAWDTTFGDSSVTVAIVDTGVQYDHPDLDGNFRSDPGYDFVDDDSDPYPVDPSQEDHGTHVAGIASAETDDGTGVAGVSESTLINARVLDRTGTGTWADVADGIQWAADEGADVINMSLGGGDSSTVKDAVSYARDAGVLLVAAAGNSSRDVANHYPAAYPECVAVSALDSDGSLASYSNYGDGIELAAPGTSVLSSIPTDDYGNLNGTSMATPVVSGVAALAASKWDLTNQGLRRHLKNTAVDVGLPSDEQGSGRVDAQNAVTTTPRRVVDDFEDGDISEYDFDRGSSGASVVSSPTHSGSYALEYADTYTEAISTSGLNVYPSAGDTFSFWVRASGGANNLNVTWGVQDHQNRYYAKLDPSEGDFYLFTYENGSGSSQDSAANLSLSQDAWYEIEVDWETDGTQTVTLYDSGGTELAQISMADSTWTSGGVGYDAYLSSGQSVYFDEVRILDSDDEGGSATVVDDFEDGDFAEYGFDRGSSGASVVSSPTHAGSYALEYAGTNTEAISTSGLDAYPSAGDTFSFWVRGSGGANNLNVTWGVQDHRNRYYAKLKPSSGGLYLFTYENGSGTQRDSARSLSLAQDAWYEIEVQWATDGTQTVTLYDSSGTQLAQISMADSTWTSGGVGYDAYLGSGEAVYFDDVTIE